MADALDTVKKLMALALNNPNPEEARSAAMKAVQMIHEQKFLLSREALTTAPTAPSFSAWADVQADIVAQRQATYQRQQQYANSFRDQYYGYWDPTNSK